MNNLMTYLLEISSSDKMGPEYNRLYSEAFEREDSTIAMAFIQLMRSIRDVEVEWVIERMWQEKAWLASPLSTSFIYKMGPMMCDLWWGYFNSMPIGHQWEVAISYDFIQRMRGLYGDRGNLSNISGQNEAKVALIWEAYRGEYSVWEMPLHNLHMRETLYHLDDYNYNSSHDEYEPMHMIDLHHHRDEATDWRVWLRLTSYKQMAKEQHERRFEMAYYRFQREDGTHGWQCRGYGDPGLLQLFILDIDHVLEWFGPIEDTIALFGLLAEGQ